MSVTLASVTNTFSNNNNMTFFKICKPSPYTVLQKDKDLISILARMFWSKKELAASHLRGGNGKNKLDADIVSSITGT